MARGYLDLVRPFAERHAADGGAGLGTVTAGDVTAFLTARSRRLAPKTAQRLATALRSLLRFWHLQGLIGGPLDRAVPKVANRRPGLPRPLEPGQVQATLDCWALARIPSSAWQMAVLASRRPDEGPAACHSDCGVWP